MEDNLYKEICKLYDFNKESKTVSFTKTFESNSLYRELLFKFCFLQKSGSVIFKDIHDLWICKNINNPKEKKLYFDIIETLLSLINNRHFDEKQKYSYLVSEFLNSTSNDKFVTFKYLQSIYSYMDDKPSYILFPLYHTLLFENSIISDNIKADLKSIISDRLEALKLDDNIIYNKIDNKFLKYFNKLLNKNEKNPKQFYDYLCGIEKNKLEENEKESDETFNYFSLIKEPIINYEKKTKEKSNDSGNNINNNEKGIENKNKNGPTRNSSVDLNSINNNNDMESNKLSNNNINKADDESSKKYITEDRFFKEMSLFGSSIILNNLCQKISYIINNLNINKNALDKYNELNALNIDNKLLLNKLSSTMLLLQNANTINIKRKLVESLNFAILEKNHEILEFKPNYIQSKSNLKDLKEINIELKDKCNDLKEKKILKEDLDRLNEKIDAAKEGEVSGFIKVKDVKNNKRKEKARTPPDSLRSRKKNSHPFVHASSDKLNLYLLPRSLFKSDIKYTEYIFTLEDIIEKKEKEKKDEEKKENELNKDENLNIYKENKEIKMDEALKILLGKNAVKSFCLKGDDVDLLKEKKNSLKYNLKTFQKYCESFIQIAPEIGEEKFEITEEIKNNESEFIEKLNNFGNSFSKILKYEIERNKALEEINSLKKIVKEEVEEAQLYTSKIFRMQNKEDNIGQKIASKINRIQLIIHFLKEQSNKFYQCVKDLYKEYEDSCNEIIKKSEFIKETIKYNSQLEDENLTEKWIKTNP